MNETLGSEAQDSGDNSHNSEGWDKVAELAGDFTPDSQVLNNPGSNPNDPNYNVNESSKELSKEDFPPDQYLGKSHNQDPYTEKILKMAKDLLYADWQVDERSLSNCCGESSKSIVDAVRNFAASVEDDICGKGILDEPINRITGALSNYYSGVAEKITEATKPNYETEQDSIQFSALRPLIKDKNKSIAEGVDAILKSIENDPNIPKEIKDDLLLIRDSAAANNNSGYDTLLPDNLKALIEARSDTAKRQAAKDLCGNILYESSFFRNLSNHPNILGKKVTYYANALSEVIETSKLSVIKGILGYVTGDKNSFSASPKSSGSTNSVSGVSDFSTDEFV
ncbi:hypothetical protein IKF04_01170 [Candidatus Saccharibacteria bacterium]|nr:hypothetical protein [Candidatus Saccharibacteria bacterium]